MVDDEQANLLALKSKDGRITILEFENEKFLAGKEEAATRLGIWSRRLTLKDLKSREYREARFFDMRDPVVCKIFFLEQWIHFFNPADSSSRVSDSG